MLVANLEIGDRLEDYRRGVRLTVTAIEPCGSCACGWGEITFDEERSSPALKLPPRKLTKTFKQFERLKFIRREGDCR